MSPERGGLLTAGDTNGTGVTNGMVGHARLEGADRRDARDGTATRGPLVLGQSSVAHMEGLGTSARVPGFTVSLEQFEGPFDLLLALIARRRLDVTELALAEVTDDFLAHMNAQWDLSTASEFLVVASTLLALKAHRLLPQDEDETSSEDLELLEARDLLFARLLQYRAYKQASSHLRALADAAARSWPRQVPLESHLAALLPELIVTIGPQELARRAVAAFTRPDDPGVTTVHLHEQTVPVAGQAIIIVNRLRTLGQATFSQLVADADSMAVVVARFLALLILHRDATLTLDQDEIHGEITVTWCGRDTGVTGGQGGASQDGQLSSFEQMEEEFA